MAAISQTTVPWCSVIVRNVFGVAGAILAVPTAATIKIPGGGKRSAVIQAFLPVISLPGLLFPAIPEALHRPRRSCIFAAPFQ
mgnify:CR=1 FL=1